jgi:ERCC4-type nuclease
MLIRIDTREQHPLDFDRCAVVRDTIPTFDYSIEGDQLHFAVERKSLPDLIQSLAIQKNYCRELKKIRRARALQKMPRIFYVVEANREDIEHFDFSHFAGGRVGSDFIFHQLSELEYFQDVHVIFSGDAIGAARDIYRLLKRRAEDLKQQEAAQ